MGRKLAILWCASVAAMGSLAPAAAQDVLEECPREHLRAVYLQAVERHEIVDLAAVEVEVLKLCRERQELVREILRGERELADLLDRGSGEAGTRRSGAGTEKGGLPALLAVAEYGDGGVANTTTPSSLAPDSAASNEGDREAPTYRWFTVYGSGPALVAGVSDGVGRWWVKAGDRLPGEVEVVSVGVRPVSVRVAVGERQWQLAGPGDPAGPLRPRSETTP